jgi:hypothetical protein
MTDGPRYVPTPTRETAYGTQPKPGLTRWLSPWRIVPALVAVGLVAYYAYDLHVWAYRNVPKGLVSAPDSKRDAAAKATADEWVARMKANNAKSGDIVAPTVAVSGATGTCDNLEPDGRLKYGVVIVGDAKIRIRGLPQGATRFEAKTYGNTPVIIEGKLERAPNNDAFILVTALPRPLLDGNAQGTIIFRNHTGLQVERLLLGPSDGVNIEGCTRGRPPQPRGQ